MQEEVEGRCCSPDGPDGKLVRAKSEVPPFIHLWQSYPIKGLYYKMEAFDGDKLLRLQP